MTEVENNGKEYYVRTGTGYKQITVATNKELDIGLLIFTIVPCVHIYLVCL